MTEVLQGYSTSGLREIPSQFKYLILAFLQIAACTREKQHLPSADLLVAF